MTMSYRGWLALLALVAGAACSDFATAPDRYPASLEVTPTEVLMTEGDSVPFAVTVFDQAGEVYASLPGWAAPLWTSADEAALVFPGPYVGRAVASGETGATVDVAGITADVVVRANPVELEVGVAFAYVTQSVQRRAGDVPLVAGRPGLLRVYVTGVTANFFEPAVRATFYQGGAAVHTATAAAEVESIPQLVDEGDLALTYDIAVPGSAIQPGTGLVIEVDPDGVVPSSPGSEVRVPASGELALDVMQVPPFRVRMVPVNQSVNGIDSRLDEDAAAAVLGLAHDLYPFAELDMDMRAPYTTDEHLTDANSWVRLIQDIDALRTDDGSPRYYYGGFPLPSGSPYAGLGYIGYPVSIGTESSPSTVAHELGHNLSLWHAPGCEAPEADADYPYTNGVIGQYGWNRSRGTLRDPQDTFDLMTYCDPVWISDFFYEKVIEYRDTSSFDAAFLGAGSHAGFTAETDVLILQGGVLDGALRLEPALASRTRPRLPDGGPYTLEGLDANGAALFSLAVSPRRLDHLDAAVFTVAVPTSMARPDRLATLRLTGPEGTVERRRSPGPRTGPPPLVLEAAAAGSPFARVRWDADDWPLAVVRDRASGQIVAMGRRGQVALPAGDPAALEVALSDGIETHPTELVR